MAALINLFYKKQSAKSTKKDLIEKDFRELAGTASEIYNRLPENMKERFRLDFQDHADQLDESYKNQDWTLCEDTMTSIRLFLSKNVITKQYD